MRKRKLTTREVNSIIAIVIFLVQLPVRIYFIIRDLLDKLLLTPTAYKRKKLLLQQADLDWIKRQNIHYMSGTEFELYLKRIFENLGYSVNLTSQTNDQGADLIIHNPDELVAVQAKRYNKNVGNKAVQEVVAAVNYYRTNRGMVVTNSSFTKSAYDLAYANNIELIDGQQLNFMILKMENIINNKIKENLSNHCPQCDQIINDKTSNYCLHCGVNLKK
jgi:HJR/Mrr/RecB family endonuclease